MDNSSLTRLSLTPGKGFSDLVDMSGPGRLLHISGHVGFGPDGATIVTGGLGAEADATLDNIATTLHEVGATLSDLVKITAYLVDLSDYAEYSAVRQRRLGDTPPASSAVGIAQLLHGALIEIDAVAFIPH